MSLNTFTQSYIETALWDRIDNGYEPLKLDYSSVNDLDDDTHKSMINDCKQFYNINWSLFNGNTDEQAGHDFWLTRNEHGAGFWDGDYPEDGNLLTKRSHVFGKCNLIQNNDGTLSLLES